MSVSDRSPICDMKISSNYNVDDDDATIDINTQKYTDDDIVDYPIDQISKRDGKSEESDEISGVSFHPNDVEAIFKNINSGPNLPSQMVHDSLNNHPRAVYWQEKSAVVYFCCLLVCLVINIVPAVVIGIIIRENDLHDNSKCHPHNSLTLSLSTISFGFNFIILLVYGVLVYKYRNTKWIKMKTPWYMIQVFVFGFLSLIISFIYLLVYWGHVGQMPCYVYYYVSHFFLYGFDRPHFTHDIIFLSAVMRLLDNLFISGAVARQRILYILFVKNHTLQTKRSLQYQQFGTILVLLIANIVFELPFLIYWSRLDQLTLKASNLTYSTIFNVLQIVYAVLLMMIFFYYSWRTREIDKFFSDWVTNVKVAFIYVLYNIIYYPLSIANSWRVDLGIAIICIVVLIFGFWFQVSHYIMTAFTKELLYSMKFGPSEKKIEAKTTKS